MALRTERLDPGSPDYGANAGLYALADHRPDKQSLMVDFNPSEFSRVRLQLAHDRSRPGRADNQLFLQYPDEPGRARRAQLLTGERHDPSHSLCRLCRAMARARAAGPRRAARDQCAIQ